MKQLLLVYNANSGVFNAALDSLLKFFSSSSYSCDLCVITHGSFGIRKDWEEFIQNLKIPVRFIHKDEWMQEFKEEIALPAVLLKSEESIKIIVQAAEMKRMDSQMLMTAIKEKLANLSVLTA